MQSVDIIINSYSNISTFTFLLHFFDFLILVDRPVATASQENSRPIHKLTDRMPKCLMDRIMERMRDGRGFFENGELEYPRTMYSA